jgi:putative tricarboxylic transport membrane protein
LIKDLGCGVAGLALAAAYYSLADDLPRSLLADPTGADGLPKALAVLLGGLSLLLILGALRRRASAGEAADEGWAKHLRSAGMLGLGVAYLGLVGWLGYLPTIVLFILAVALYAGTRPGWQPVAISAVGGVLLWFTFTRLFNIPMPAGTLF